MIFSLLILLVLSVLGVAASNTTNFELRMAANERDYQGTLFAAEAGVNHMRQYLADKLEDRLANASASGFNIDFNFASVIIENNSFEPYKYTVTFKPADSSYRKVYINSEAELGDGTGPQEARVILEVLVEAVGEGDSLLGYGAQEGGGSGKNYNSNDLEAVQGNTMTSLGQI